MGKPRMVVKNDNDKVLQDTILSLRRHIHAQDDEMQALVDQIKCMRILLEGFQEAVKDGEARVVLAEEQTHKLEDQLRRSKEDVKARDAEIARMEQEYMAAEHKIAELEESIKRETHESNPPAQESTPDTFFTPPTHPSSPASTSSATVAFPARTFADVREALASAASEDNGTGQPSVDDMRIEGSPLVGHVLRVRARFANCQKEECMFQWFRIREGDRTHVTEISNATKDEYTPNSDDFATVLRVECIPPGENSLPVKKETRIDMDQRTRSKIDEMLSNGKGSFKVVTLEEEAPRTLVLEKHKLKIRDATGKTTLSKDEYSTATEILLDEWENELFFLHMARNKDYTLRATSTQERDLLALATRHFAYAHINRKSVRRRGTSREMFGTNDA
eukprot:TRINITY_DN2376_c0_g1_i3.p2 TRINITY_DN2376_c0_g1~~TRINITY_DN2376_c0_g1_i3.p2  ORF type:complete len:392 (+),score=103.22 TRINITY_DN2376_c0_g1_i3:731-1906(+)